jgi:hypothetical protein
VPIEQNLWCRSNQRHEPSTSSRRDALIGNVKKSGPAGRVGRGDRVAARCGRVSEGKAGFGSGYRRGMLLIKTIRYRAAKWFEGSYLAPRVGVGTV